MGVLAATGVSRLLMALKALDRPPIDTDIHHPKIATRAFIPTPPLPSRFFPPMPAAQDRAGKAGQETAAASSSSTAAVSSSSSSPRPEQPPPPTAPTLTSAPQERDPVNPAARSDEHARQDSWSLQHAAALVALRTPRTRAAAAAAAVAHSDAGGKGGKGASDHPPAPWRTTGCGDSEFKMVTPILSLLTQDQELWTITGPLVVEGQQANGGGRRR